MEEQREEQEPRREPNERQSVYRRANRAVDLNNMRQNGELCDVTIKINEMEIRCHKVVLASALPYFRTLFLSNFRESAQDLITMTTVNEANMEALISFAYTGEIHLSENNALSLLQDADYLSENDVKEACVGFLSENLRPEMAIELFQFANTIDCTPLKDSAKQTILSNFMELSYTAAYYDLEFPHLQYILDSPEVYVFEPSEYFERIVQWIVHDMPNRTAHMRDLLRLVYIRELTADYLIDYLYESINPENDAIIRDIMSFYRDLGEYEVIRRNRPNRRRSLITIDRAMLSQIQLYDFETASWSVRYHNIDHKHYTISAVLKNKLYIIGGRSDVRCLADVKLFDPLTNVIIGVAPMSLARRDCAACTSSNFLFVCGGRGDDGLALNLVEKYDPDADRWETLAPMNTPRYSAAAVIFQGCLYVIGGCGRDEEELNVMQRYDPASMQWTVLGSMLSPRMAFDVAVLNGKIYACGGWEKNSVEVYNPRSLSWQECANMQKRRDSFLLVAYDGKLIAVGGETYPSVPTVETYNPNTGQWTYCEHCGLHNKHITEGLIQI